MNIIASIIVTLTKEEKVSFLLEQKQKNKRYDTKNIELFKLLDVNPTIQDVDVLLYGRKSKGAYHALCKRLHDSLIDFIAVKNFEGEQSDEMEVFKLVLVSKIFFEQKVYKAAFRTLKKAEQKAKKYEFYGILNEIYYTRIQYAHLDSKTPLEELIKEFQLNKQSFEQEENLNIFYASVQNGLLEHKVNSVQMITDVLSRFNISIDNGFSFRSLFNIVEITNKVANETRDFYSVLPFVENLNKQIEQKGVLVEKHLFYHIQILYYIANSYFRNKEFEVSQYYLEKVEEGMTKFNKKYYKRFLPQFTLLKVFNLNYCGNAKDAITILEIFEYTKFKESLTYVLDLKLARVVFYFQQSRYKDALSFYRESQHSDKWYAAKAGIIWVVKKNLLEIMLYMELGNVDLVESRVRSFRKKHDLFLRNNNEFRVLEFLSLVTHYFYNKESLVVKSFLGRVRRTLVKTKSENEDVFVMSFYAWLKARVLERNVYETTLDLVLLQNRKT